MEDLRRVVKEAEAATPVPAAPAVPEVEQGASTRWVPGCLRVFGVFLSPFGWG